MIEKIIHYCWFGGKELPEQAKKYIETWKKYLPDYKIVKWDESNFDVNKVAYVKEAYDSKKFAFVTDYVRLYVIYKYGGIYMDTDVEVCQNLDLFLNEKAFSGFESYTDIPTGIMAGERGLPIYKELLEYYDDKHFIDNEGNMDLTTNVEIFTNIFKKYGLVQNNTKQTLIDYTFYPKIMFCPTYEDIKKNNKLKGNKIFTIHHFAGSWLPENEIRRRNSILFKLKLKIKLIIRKILILILGRKRFEKLRGRNYEE